jgi:hypothetical protein
MISIVGKEEQHLLDFDVVEDQKRSLGITTVVSDTKILELPMM